MENIFFFISLNMKALCFPFSLDTPFCCYFQNIILETFFLIIIFINFVNIVSHKEMQSLFLCFNKHCPSSCIFCSVLDPSLQKGLWVAQAHADKSIKAGKKNRKHDIEGTTEWIGAVLFGEQETEGRTHPSLQLNKRKFIKENIGPFSQWQVKLHQGRPRLGIRKNFFM